MTEHLPDVKVTEEQEARVVEMANAMSKAYWGYRSAACVIVHLQDRIAELQWQVDETARRNTIHCEENAAQARTITELTESLRQQESQLRAALDELRKPAENPFDKSKAVFAGKSKDGYLLKCWFESQEDLDAAFDVVERLPVTTEATPK